MYDISCVMRNIRNNKKLYTLILLELILCFTMMIIGFDEKIAFHNRKLIFEKEEKSGLVTISDEKGSYLFSFNSYQFDAKTLPPNVIYANVYILNYLTSTGKVNTLKVISANKYFYEHYFGVSIGDNQCYISKKFKDDWKDGNVFLDQDVSISGNKLSIQKFDLDISVIDKNIVIPTSVYEQNDIDTGRFLLFVEESVAEILPIEKIATFIKIHKDENIDKLIDMLTPYNNSSLYQINLLADFEKGSNSLTAFVRLFGWVSYIAVIVVMLGTSGVFMVFLDKRKKSYAIEYCFGASNFRLKLQLFFEIFTVIILSIVISSLIAMVLESNVSSIYYMIKINAISILLSILLGISVTFIILIISGTGVTMRNVKKWIK